MFKKTIPSILVFAIIVLLTNACAPLSHPEIDETKNEQGTILFADDFSDPPSGWGIWNQDGGVVEYLDGGLHFQVEDDYFDFWSVAGKSFSDVQIEVDVLKRSGPDDNDFGIICRYLNKDNFYMLVASSDGYYGIAKVKEGQYSMIGMDQLQYSDAILPGRAINHLRVDCVGETLRFYANGLKLMEAHDSDFRSGDVGLVAGAYKEIGVDILFDQFVVSIP
ncbi:MAG: hypothetical protein IH586_20625, partial [Anaerolineaceae bacterium]|nr:hypothetical protein [Anaerolineaceae bacterium]